MGLRREGLNHLGKSRRCYFLARARECDSGTDLSTCSFRISCRCVHSESRGDAGSIHANTHRYCTYMYVYSVRGRVISIVKVRRCY